ncbi:hypothetical protein [Streptomyces sp. NPDC002156]
MVTEKPALLVGLSAPGGTRAEQLATALEDRIRGLTPDSPVGTIEASGSPPAPARRLPSPRHGT